MSIIVTNVLQLAAEVYLNDAGRSHFDDAVLLPYCKSAYKDLQVELLENGILTLSEVSAPIVVPASTTSVTDAGLMPSNLIQPIELLERVLDTDDWQPMFKRDWEPTDDPNLHDYLEVWAWREEDIKFRGARQQLYVLIRYRKSLSDIVDVNSVIPVTNSDQFLAARIAAYASGFGAGNTQRAKAANDASVVALNKLMGIKVKDNQIPVRARGFGYRRRARRYWF